MSTYRFVRVAVVTALASLAAAGWSSTARADVTLAEGGGWTVYTNGRVSAFFSYLNGQAFPPPGRDADGRTYQLPNSGGIPDNTDGASSDAPPDRKGKIESMRIRSGFVGNVFGFGVRRKLGEDTTLKLYMHIHSLIEPPDRRKWEVIIPDFREAYFEVDGPWGSAWAGRSLSLFSRGATEITYLYGFEYSLGVPARVDQPGPGTGHIGFGVLANNFAPGAVYTTPSLVGLRLAVGLFDPNALTGAWERTKWPRPESELTFDTSKGSFLLHLFANGCWQKVYARDSHKNATVYGGGAGGRVEVGPVHLGVAGHYGKGLGMSFALQPAEDLTSASQEGQNNELRIFDGYYAQLQVALGRFDLNAGYGATRVHKLKSDLPDLIDDDGDPSTPAANDDANPAANDPQGFNHYKQQVGISGGVWYHLTDQLHLSLDYFRASYEWYLANRKQVANFVNLGATADW